MVVVNFSIEKIEKIPADNRCKDNCSPILTHAIHTKFLGQETRVKSIQDPVADSSKTGNGSEVVRILYLQSTELCGCERQC